MTRQEAGRLGGLATVQKYGTSHMSKIGKVGWQACLTSIAERQAVNLLHTKGNSFRNLLRNLKSKKGR